MDDHLLRTPAQDLVKIQETRKLASFSITVFLTTPREPMLAAKGST